MRGLLFAAIFTALLLAGCIAPPKSDEERIKERLDGYRWSWACFDQRVPLVVWKENIDSVEKRGGFWLVKARASEAGDAERRPGGESSTLLMSINASSGEVVRVIHGCEIGGAVFNQATGEFGNITCVYC